MDIFLPDVRPLDPRLDRLPSVDPRNRRYPIMTRLLATERVGVRKIFYRGGPTMDQGAEGACVGFGCTKARLLAPSALPLTQLYWQGSLMAPNEYARWAVYKEAQKIDEWEGEGYEGTSVLAGLKILHRLGLIEEYRWAFTVDEILQALCNEGPVVMGVPWYNGMYKTRPSGMVEVSGSIVGGHCIVLSGFHPRMRIKGEGWWKRWEVVEWWNSWGETYGKQGRGYVQIPLLEKLFTEGGEAAVLVGRRRSEDIIR